MNPILIAGPTASGKSALALELAEQIGGAVINTDSMQVYRDLRILSARPSVDDEQRVPHLLYGILGIEEVCSAGRWAELAGRALSDVRALGRVPIFVGGTGLYFRALTEGLSPIPAIPGDIRVEARALHESLGGEGLWSRLALRDRESADRIKPSDTQRLIRAWEVIEATGRPLGDWQHESGQPLVEASALKVVLAPDRAWLHARCDARLDSMLEAGGLDEVRALMKRGLSADLPGMKALGVPQIAAALRGEQTIEDAALAAKAATRRYVKRQTTWFRNQMITWPKLIAQDSESLREKFFSFIRKSDLTGP